MTPSGAGNRRSFAVEAPSDTPRRAPRRRQVEPEIGDPSPWKHLLTRQEGRQDDAKWSRKSRDSSGERLQQERQDDAKWSRKSKDSSGERLQEGRAEGRAGVPGLETQGSRAVPLDRLLLAAVPSGTSTLPLGPRHTSANSPTWPWTLPATSPDRTPPQPRQICADLAKPPATPPTTPPEIEGFQR